MTLKYYKIDHKISRHGNEHAGPASILSKHRHDSSRVSVFAREMHEHDVGWKLEKKDKKTKPSSVIRKKEKTKQSRNNKALRHANKGVINEGLAFKSCGNSADDKGEKHCTLWIETQFVNNKVRPLVAERKLSRLNLPCSFSFAFLFHFLTQVWVY